MPAKHLLSVKEVAARFGVSTACVWKWARTDVIPKPIKIGPRTTRWRLEDIEKWEATRKEP